LRPDSIELINPIEPIERNKNRFLIFVRFEIISFFKAIVILKK